MFDQAERDDLGLTGVGPTLREPLNLASVAQSICEVGAAAAKAASNADSLPVVLYSSAEDSKAETDARTEHLKESPYAQEREDEKVLHKMLSGEGRTSRVADHIISSVHDMDKRSTVLRLWKDEEFQNGIALLVEMHASYKKSDRSDAETLIADLVSPELRTRRTAEALLKLLGKEPEFARSIIQRVVSDSDKSAVMEMLASDTPDALKRKMRSWISDPDQAYKAHTIANLSKSERTQMAKMFGSDKHQADAELVVSHLEPRPLSNLLRIATTDTTRAARVCDALRQDDSFVRQLAVQLLTEDQPNEMVWSILNSKELTHEFKSFSARIGFEPAVKALQLPNDLRQFLQDVLKNKDKTELVSQLLSKFPEGDIRGFREIYNSPGLKTASDRISELIIQAEPSGSSRNVLFWFLAVVKSDVPSPRREDAEKLLMHFNDPKRGALAERAMQHLPEMESVTALVDLCRTPSTKAAGMTFLDLLEEPRSGLASGELARLIERKEATQLLDWLGTDRPAEMVQPAKRMVERINDPETRDLALQLLPRVFSGRSTDENIKRMNRALTVIADPGLHAGLRALHELTEVRDFSSPRSLTRRLLLDPVLGDGDQSRVRSCFRLIKMFNDPQQKSLARSMVENLPYSEPLTLIRLMDTTDPRLSSRLTGALAPQYIALLSRENPVVRDCFVAQQVIDLLKSPKPELRRGAAMYMELYSDADKELAANIAGMLADPFLKRSAEVLLSRARRNSEVFEVCRLVCSPNKAARHIGEKLISLLSEGSDAVENLTGLLNLSEAGPISPRTLFSDLCEKLVSEPERTKRLLKVASSPGMLSYLAVMERSDSIEDHYSKSPSQRGHQIVDRILKMSEEPDTAASVQNIMQRSVTPREVKSLVLLLDDPKLRPAAERLLELMDDIDTELQARRILEATSLPAGQAKEAADSILKALADPLTTETASKLIYWMATSPSSIVLIARLLRQDTQPELNEALVHHLSSDYRGAETDLTQLAVRLASKDEKARAEGDSLLGMLSQSKYRATALRRLRAAWMTSQ